MGFKGLATIGPPPALGAPEERNTGLGLVPEAEVVDGAPASHARPAPRLAKASNELGIRHVGDVFCHGCGAHQLLLPVAMFPP